MWFIDSSIMKNNEAYILKFILNAQQTKTQCNEKKNKLILLNFYYYYYYFQ